MRESFQRSRSHSPQVVHAPLGLLQGSIVTIEKRRDHWLDTAPAVIWADISDGGREGGACTQRRAYVAGERLVRILTDSHEV